MRFLRWLPVAVLSLGSLSLVACGRAEAESQDESQSSGPIGSERAHALVEGGATLLDVRTPGEYASGHPAPAINVPVAELRGRLNEIPRDKPVVVYCVSGRRSAAAVDELRAAGYDVHDLARVDRW